MLLIQRKDVAMTTDEIATTLEKIANFAQFQIYYALYDCWRTKINNIYKAILKEQVQSNSKNTVNPSSRAAKSAYETINTFDSTSFYIPAAFKVWKNRLDEAKAALSQCLSTTVAKTTSDKNQPNIANQSTTVPADITPGYAGPFDKRLNRYFQNENNVSTLVNPFDAAQATTSVNGYTTNQEFIQNAKLVGDEQEKLLKKLRNDILKMQNDAFHFGPPSLINTYSITRLYGSNGGEFLTQQRNTRRWYEVDTLENAGDIQNFAVTPTTSSLISWGNGDPYGRTPYHFSDFVFCKWWNVIPNNRMITLRRFAAPIVDNMKFPGMDGFVENGVLGNYDASDNFVKGSDTKTDGGSGSKTFFPPVATAITYFGEGTNNTIGSMLKFTTGMNWGEVKAAMFEVETTTTPDSEAGPNKIFGTLSKYAKMLNIAQGKYDLNAVMNDGNMPPDPYSDGPYSNRVQGPVDRIDAVKKREAGLKFENKIDLTFEYVGRPVGGINPKASLLDIMSNFLVMGSASAMFWGGQHRFMGNPVTYPFTGGDKAAAQFYRGNPVGWAKATVASFGDSIAGAGKAGGDFAKNFFNTILSGKSAGNVVGDLIGLFTGDNIAGNVIKNKLAEAGQGQIPYLIGLKALLIGEPVGEWHVTVGNPLNPIAMIGNLICTSMDLEFGEELGPDDFPTTIKLTVHLEHGMARDRDAIQSIFNRGMGRIYDLPDNLSFSSQFQTEVDNYTKSDNPTGTMTNGRYGILATMGTTGRTSDKPAILPNANSGEVTVWNRGKFTLIPPDAPLNTPLRSTYKSLAWVAKKSLK